MQGLVAWTSLLAGAALAGIGGRVQGFGRRGGACWRPRQGRARGRTTHDGSHEVAAAGAEGGGARMG